MQYIRAREETESDVQDWRKDTKGDKLIRAAFQTHPVMLGASAPIFPSLTSFLSLFYPFPLIPLFPPFFFLLNSISTLFVSFFVPLHALSVSLSVCAVEASVFFEFSVLWSLNRISEVECFSVSHNNLNCSELQMVPC